jgi:uncharacterized protein (TIGR02246 family)
MSNNKQPSSTDMEKMAIGKILQKVGKAFGMMDASLLEDCYAEDADWVNAFGTTRKGRENIIEYLEKLFEDERFSQGKMVGEPQGSIRLLKEDVAIAKTYVERKGQGTRDGGEIDSRHNHSLKVLVKKEGNWLIVSDMYMDERDEKTLVS